MVNLGCEGHLGGLEGVVGREMDVQEEDTTLVGRVLRSHDRGLPVELVSLVGGASGAVGGRVTTKVDQLLLDSFKRHNIDYKFLNLSHRTNTFLVSRSFMGFLTFGYILSF